MWQHRLPGPVKELKGFEKVTLKPGESTSVVFTVDEPMLRFFGFDNRLISEAGTFELMVGTSSDDRDLLKKRIYTCQIRHTDV